MQFSREINRLLNVALVAFMIVGLSAAYWAINGADTILQRQDNPRLVESEFRIWRGSIFDRNGEVLVESTAGENSAVSRHYLHPETYGALGYFSERYGVGGVEAGYDAILRGDDLVHDWNSYLSADLLHRPQVGSDIRLTFDLEVQQALANAMAGQSGAAIVLAVPSGQVLAMVSLPDYDPNTLDEDWESLIAAPGQPFFNRVLQGQYQPGGVLQTALMAAGILGEQPLDMPIQDATRPVEIANTTLQCTVILPTQALTIREAYAFGCPNPFEKMSEDMGIETIQAIFNSFQLNHQPTLPGYVLQSDAIPSTTQPTFSLNTDNWLENVLGQGSLTVTPLEMALIAGAIVNDGNAPQPYTLLNIRRPNSDTWVEADGRHSTIPMMTANTARQLQDLMRFTVANGAAQNAGRPDIDIGGHAALAYSGSEFSVMVRRVHNPEQQTRYCYRGCPGKYCRPRSSCGHWRHSPGSSTQSFSRFINTVHNKNSSAFPHSRAQPQFL